MYQLYDKHCERVISQRPLILCLTNFVTVSDCANALLAIGASPVMSQDPEDACQLAGLASALVLNIGTLTQDSLRTMSRAAQVARERNIPIVLDPVGAGATGPRLEASQKLLEEARPWLVKGNASEIMALSGASGQKQKGVDSEIETDSNERFWEVALEAKKFSATHKVLVGVTGKTDLLTDGEKGIAIEGGSILLTKLTGTGCLLSALCGAFMAVGPQEPLDAANAAFSLVSRSGERAAASLSRPGAMGEFKARFFDELSLSYKGTDSR